MKSVFVKRIYALDKRTISEQNELKGFWKIYRKIRKEINEKTVTWFTASLFFMFFFIRFLGWYKKLR